MIAQDIEEAAQYLRERFPGSSTSPTARRCREAIQTLERAALDASLGEDDGLSEAPAERLARLDSRLDALVVLACILLTLSVVSCVTAWVAVFRG